MKHKTIIELSEYYESCRRLTTLDIIKNRDNPNDPRPKLTMNTDNLKMNEYEKKRSGRPKNAWWQYALKSIWSRIETIETDEPKHPNNTEYNPENTAHQEEIEHFTESHGDTLANKKERKRETHLNPQNGKDRETI